MTIRTLAAAAAAACLVQGASAAAQYMPHLDPNLYMLTTMNMSGGGDPCLGGTALPEREIAEARDPARAVMQGYFRAAAEGGAKSAAFHLDENARWQGGGATAAAGDLDRKADPLAAPGQVLETEPLRFYRAGAGGTALGQWAVLDGQGQVAGVYTALFARHRGDWKLRELTVSRAGDTVEPAAQYCRKPGDVMEHRLSSTETWRESAQEQLDEARARLATATAAEARAEAARAEKPRDDRLYVAAREARRNRERQARQVEQREETLAQAIEAFDKARSDADEIRRLTGEARLAQAFRVADTETAAAN